MENDQNNSKETNNKKVNEDQNNESVDYQLARAIDLILALNILNDQPIVE